MLMHTNVGKDIQILRVISKLSKQTGSLGFFFVRMACGEMSQPRRLSVFGIRLIRRGCAVLTKMNFPSEDSQQHGWFITSLWHLLRLRSGLIYGAEHFQPRTQEGTSGETEREKERRRQRPGKGDSMLKKMKNECSLIFSLSLISFRFLHWQQHCGWAFGGLAHPHTPKVGIWETTPTRETGGL